jgi:drug/metabolite transporter (DMT)-like permease
MVFSLPFFVVSAYASSSQAQNVKFTLRQWISVAVIGCLGYYVSSLLDFLGLRYISAGTERLILFIYPTLVLIMSSVIFKIKISPIQWLAVFITYIGLALAFFGELDFGTTPTGDFYRGSAMIFACAITYAAYIVGSGQMIPLVGAAKFNSYAMSFACIGVLVHFFFAGTNSLLHLPVLVYVYGLCMAILSTVIPSYLVSEGIKRIGSDNAAIVGSIGPVSTIIQAHIFLYEPILTWQIAGTICILAGVLLIGRKQTQTV